MGNISLEELNRRKQGALTEDGMQSPGHSPADLTTLGRAQSPEGAALNPEGAALSPEGAARPQELTPQEREKVDAIKNSLDLMDSQACVQYGTGAQRNISDFAESILSTVRAKDSGYVGDLLGDLVTNVKELDVGNPGDDKGFLDKLPFFKNARSGLTKLVSRYEKLEVQIDRIEAELDKAKMEMLKDIGMFDTMYEKNLDYFHQLNLYIAAGEEKVRELREEDLPRLRQQAEASANPMDAQLVHDFEENVNRFEKKVHDLKLSRTIALQAAPQIKLIQNNDKLLVDKIQTAVLNTIPIWKSQVVIALGLGRQQKVLRLNQEISKTTNELLTRNSELLKTNTIETARETERSVVDIETLSRTNANLISTIEETLKIQQEGRQKRQAAEAELLKLEGNLKTALRRA